MDATTRLTRLLRTLPGPDATPTERAQWFMAKADTLHSIADQSSEFASECRELANVARRRAAQCFAQLENERGTGRGGMTP